MPTVAQLQAAVLSPPAVPRAGVSYTAEEYALTNAKLLLLAPTGSVGYDNTIVDSQYTVLREYYLRQALEAAGYTRSTSSSTQTQLSTYGLSHSIILPPKPQVPIAGKVANYQTGTALIPPMSAVQTALQSVSGTAFVQATSLGGGPQVNDTGATVAQAQAQIATQSAAVEHVAEVDAANALYANEHPQNFDIKEGLRQGAENVVEAAPTVLAVAAVVVGGVAIAAAAGVGAVVGGISSVVSGGAYIARKSGVVAPPPPKASPATPAPYVARQVAPLATPPPAADDLEQYIVPLAVLVAILLIL